MKIDRNSWHFKVARFGALDDWDDRTDFCGYFWALVRGAVLFPAVLIGGAFAVSFVLVACPLVALVVWFQYGQLVLLGPEVVGWIAWTGALLYLCYRRASKKESDSPAVRLAKTAYQGWKDKTCVLVEIH